MLISWGTVFSFLFSWAIKFWQQRGPSMSEKLGQQEQKTREATQQLTTEKAVTQAIIDAPRTNAEVDVSLRAGTF